MGSGKPSLLKGTIEAVKACPREIFNSCLFFCTAVWSFPGVAKGFDEGNVVSVVVMKSFRKCFDLDQESEDQYANTKGWIVAMATAGAVFGCLSCINLVQRLGRKNTLLLFKLVYIAGIFGQTFSNGSLSGLYAGRFIAGLRIGTTTVIPSIYLTEIAPRSIRGLVTLQTMLHAATGISGSDPVLPLHDKEALSGSLAEFRQTKLIEVDLGSAEMCAAYQNYVDMVVQTYPFASSSQLSEYREAAIMASRDNRAEDLPEHLAVTYLGTATGLLLDAHYTHKEFLGRALLSVQLN